MGHGAKKTHVYDLHAGDTFWADHLGAGFQEVAADLEKDFNEYRTAMDQINAVSGKLDADFSDGCGSVVPLADMTQSLACTINALPELQEGPIGSLP